MFVPDGRHCCTLLCGHPHYHHPLMSLSPEVQGRVGEEAGLHAASRGQQGRGTEVEGRGSGPEELQGMGVGAQGMGVVACQGLALALCLGTQEGIPVGASCRGTSAPVGGRQVGAQTCRGARSCPGVGPYQVACYQRGETCQVASSPVVGPPQRVVVGPSALLPGDLGACLELVGGCREGEALLHWAFRGEGVAAHGRSEGTQEMRCPGGSRPPHHWWRRQCP
mmetsp:Transcript_19015/g.40959  ORF Transcript_19015/g.40959 Transcript_19015/m.40959 type:complete len:223 (-) Transcript_19015:2188-2856(-)